MASPSDCGGAAGFFGRRSVADTADMAVRTVEAEVDFEAGCVRAVLKHFRVDPKGWRLSDPDVPVKDRFRLHYLDEAWPAFPVRLGSTRAAGRGLGRASTKISQKGFHELDPNQLLGAKAFARTKVVDEWESVAGDQSLDARPVGVLFRCVGTAHVMHDWVSGVSVPGCRLVWTRDDGKEFTVEPLPEFVARVAASGWLPPPD